MIYLAIARDYDDVTVLGAFGSETHMKDVLRDTHRPEWLAYYCAVFELTIGQEFKGEPIHEDYKDIAYWEGP